MFCCSFCLNDKYLISEFSSNKVIGICSYCRKKDLDVIDVNLLSHKFANLLESYSTVNDIELYQTSDTKFSKGDIINQLNEDWGEILNSPNNYELLKDILGIYYDDFKNLFNENVLLTLKYEKKNRERNLEREKLWEVFKNEIKTNFRYRRVKSSKIDEFSELLKLLVIKIPIGTVLYRSRLSNKSGYRAGEMGMPPANIATAGRANPKGIPYLYLAKELDTTIYEIRSALHNYVTVGEFHVKDKLNIINLRPVKEISPFQLSQIQLLDLIEYDSFIQGVMLDLAKPNKPTDSDIDYIPTQYLVEMAKDLHGIDGVEYPSSLHANGRNVVLFNESKVNCIETKVFSIDEIKYRYSLVI
jgi:RES domain-containing protein